MERRKRGFPLFRGVLQVSPLKDPGHTQLRDAYPDGTASILPDRRMEAACLRGLPDIRRRQARSNR